MVKDIKYEINVPIEAAQVAEVFRSSGIRRPVDDLERIQRMVDNANLIATAWVGERLVGIARALTDFSYCCYLSDLAVDKEYQKNGIGRHLITQIQEVLGEEASLVLLAAPNAKDYYPQIGFQRADNAFLIPRQRNV